MSHRDQIDFLRLTRESFPHYFRGQRVLEVGSLDINGSIRQLFTGCDYVGLDVGDGPGVDVVVSGENYDAPDGSFDVVASAECMEHNPEWWATTMNMVRLLRPGGLFILTCAAPGRKEHGTSRSDTWGSPLTVAAGQEHYENLTFDDFAGALLPLTTAHWMNWASRDTYITGMKGSPPPNWDAYKLSVTAWLGRRHEEEGIPQLERLALSLGKRRYDAVLPAIRFARRVRKRLGRSLVGSRRNTRRDPPRSDPH